MTPLRFDAPVARDLLEALRLYEGRLRGTGRQLSKGTEEIRLAAEVSLRVSRDQPLALSPPTPHDDLVVSLLTYDEVAGHLRVSLATVKRLVRDASLPVVRIGASARVRPTDLNAYIASLEEN